MSTPKPIPFDELPLWMRPRQRVIDWGLFLVLTFGLITAWPLVARAGLPRENQAIVYAYRSYEVAQIVQSGVLFSRWSPDFVYAYGSPLFNFLAPLPHYLPGYHQALTDVTAITSVKLFMVLSILAGGAGMYAFSRRRWGTLAGITAALLYITSPPLLYTLPYITGDLGLLMALGLLPWALWALDQVQIATQGRWTALAVGVLAAYALTDMRIVVVSIPVVLWTIYSSTIASPTRRRYALAALVTVVLLTSFFWLPALMERDSIRWVSVRLDPLAGSITLTEAFSPLVGYEPNVLNPLPPRGIGFIAWIMGLVGILITATARRRYSSEVVGFALIGLFALVAATPLTANLFPDPHGFLPLLPYHVLMMALVCFCLLGAQIGGWLEMLRRTTLHWRIAGLIGVCALTLLAALPGVVPPTWANTGTFVDTVDMLQDELPGYHMATLREGILLPSSVRELPGPSPSLIPDIEAHTFRRALRQGLSAETRLDPLEQGTTQSIYTLVSERAGRADFYMFNWLGWTADLDGSPLEVETSTQGLLRVSLPVAREGGNVTIKLGGTPARDAGWALTFVGVAMLFLLMRWQRRLRRRTLARIIVPSPQRADLITLIGIIVGWGVLTAVMQANPSLISTNQTERDILPLRRFWQGGIDLLGFRLTTAQVQPGGTIPVTVYWQASRPIVATYQSEIFLSDSTGERLIVDAHRNVGYVPTLHWDVAHIVRDDFTLHIPEGFPAGDYLLRVRLTVCNIPQMQPCFDDAPDLVATDEQGRSEIGSVPIPVLIRVR
ncbi:MAG: hypothetical protein KF716_07585 [Anaerolineae bacterium]|nr:hypothetical protein [Anaerolineae bacterium]